MCGIAGYVMTAQGTAAEASVVRRMNDAIVHRGPDEDGYHVRGSVALGMRRLSIIDVAGGRQPIHNETRDIWIVYNGEVYNFPDLRSGLETQGHRFYTNTDTETLVHLYEQYGSSFVPHLRGMFAFALYDERDRRLLLARDRLGKKPLHYALVNGTFYFASEIKSILAVVPELAAKNEEAMAYYLTFGYIPDPMTAYREIHKLPLAHQLELHDGKIRLTRYWNLPQFETDADDREEAVVARLEEELSEATRIRLISDVPLGAFLSGGVDSSLVVGLMARHSSTPVKTFSITFKHEEFNEAGHAKQVAAAFHTEHTEFLVEPDAVRTLLRLSALLDEPFADPSLLPTFLVSGLARQHVTVALSGDGGDELFAGYDRYAIALRRARFAVRPKALADLYRNHVFPALPHSFPARNLLYNLSLGLRDAYIHGLTHLAAGHSGADVLSPEFRAFASGVRPEAMFARLFDEAPSPSDLGRMQALDIQTYLAGDILTKVDRMSMAASLEARAPLLDHRFVEAALRLPVKWRFRQGEQKYILKKVAEKVGVPRDVLYRPKQGFAVPLVHWIRHELRELIESTLLDATTLQRGYFDRKGVAAVLDEHMRGRRDHAYTIFQMLMFELWHRNLLDAGARPSPAGPAGVVESRVSA
jgi:asparagine synthase (glutamine-hydrolysing)